MKIKRNWKIDIIKFKENFRQEEINLYFSTSIYSVETVQITLKVFP